MKKKALILAVALAACTTSVTFATPQTQWDKGETQIDLNGWNTKASLDSFDTDNKWNFGGGITYGLSDKLALQYEYYGLKTKYKYAGSDYDATTGNSQEVNLLYSLNKNFAVYGGWDRIKNSTDGYSKNNNVAQFGVIAKAPLGKNFDVYAKGAVGSNKTSMWEAGIGYTIAKDWDITVGYRQLDTKATDDYNIKYKGLIAGISYRFGGHKAVPAATPVTPVYNEPVYTPTPTPVPAQKLDYYVDSIHFDTDIDTPMASQQGNLDEFVSAAKAHPDNTFKLVGNTDSQGNAAYNQDLSKRRVENVEKYAEDHGVPASQMKASYRGETTPASTNDTDQGRADNRRVDVYINK